MSLVMPGLNHTTGGLCWLVTLHVVSILMHSALVRLLILIVSSICDVIVLSIGLLHGWLNVLLRIQLGLTTGDAGKCRLPNLGRYLVVLKESLSYFLRVDHSSCENACVGVNHNIVGQVLRFELHLKLLNLDAVFAVNEAFLLKLFKTVTNTYKLRDVVLD